MFSGFKYCSVLSMARPFFVFIFFCLCFLFVSLHFTSLHILISFVTRRDSGARTSGEGALRISGSFESSGTILQDSDGENELFHLGFDHGGGGLCNSNHDFYRPCTATIFAPEHCGSYFGFSLHSSLIFFEKETSYLLVIFCATLFLFTYTFNYLSFDAWVYLGSFLFFSSCFISYQSRDMKG